MNFPIEIVLDSAGSNLYIADNNNQRVRKVTVSTGIITTFAGTGSGSYSGDNGPASSAALNFPRGVALDSAGTYSFIIFSNEFIYFLASPR